MISPTILFLGTGLFFNVVNLGDLGTLEPRASIDKEVIRRVVRAHINEVRRCYERGLKEKPELRGRVNVKWTIGPDGTVTSAAVQDSTLQHEPTEKCIVAAVTGWTFAKPVGGAVTINYPFVLETAGGSESAPPASNSNQADPLRSR